MSNSTQSQRRDSRGGSGRSSSRRSGSSSSSRSRSGSNRSSSRSGSSSRSPRSSSSRSRSSSRSGSSSGSTIRSRTTKPAPKLSLWNRILGFFGIGPAASVKAGGKNTSKTSSTQASSRKTTQQASSHTTPQEQQERPSVRKPEPIEVTSSRIYVGNLSFDATESDLLELFNGVGTVQNVEVVYNRHTHRSKGFAFVQMQNIEEAKRAVSELHDKLYFDRKLVVSGAKALEPRAAQEQRDNNSSTSEENTATTQGAAQPPEEAPRSTDAIQPEQ